MEQYNEPILITGCARSGTSMTAGVIHHCGAWGGNLRGPNKYNKKGMFENAEIVQGFVKPLLKRLGCDPLGQKPLPDINKIHRLPDDQAKACRRFVLETIRKQGYSGGPWYYKGAKLCLLWPLWHKAFPNARWIIVRRDPEDIVASCLRTSFMRKYQTRAGWLGWVVEHEKRFEEMHNAGLSVMEVWPQRAINGDLTELQMVINNLGLKWDFNTVREFVSPALWHKKRKG